MHKAQSTCQKDVRMIRARRTKVALRHLFTVPREPVFSLSLRQCDLQVWLHLRYYKKHCWNTLEILTPNLTVRQLWLQADFWITRSWRIRCVASPVYIGTLKLVNTHELCSKKTPVFIIGIATKCLPDVINLRHDLSFKWCFPSMTGSGR